MEEAEQPCAIDEDFRREALAMGLNPDSLQPPPDPTQWPFILLPENVESLDFFIGLSSQWSRQFTPGGRLVCLGLDYAGVEAALRLHGVPKAKRAALFSDVRVMERAALPVLNRDR